MTNMISQLVPQQGTGAHAPLTANRKLPEAVVAENKSREETIPKVQGGMDTQSVAELTGALDQLNGYLEETHRGLRFSIDNNSGRTVVRVVDTETDEVIRQIPSEEMLTVIRNISEIVGKIFDEVA
ncbi:MAG: flagellar protein FlaG [Pseudomonadota bacterium]|nr:flagellar protein FlaG [Pseudomonadota bacterium]